MGDPRSGRAELATVQLRFGADDGDAFSSAKRQLIEEFRPWADEHDGADDGSLAADAETFLSWRFDDPTGDLERADDDLIEEIWRHDRPETVELLEALGRHVTDKTLAKAARKAVVKHRSRLANRQP